MVATYSGGFSARPYTLRVHVTEHSRENHNNRSRYNVSVDVRSDSGWGSYRSDPFTAIVTIAGGDTNLTRSSGLMFSSGGDYTGKVLSVGSFVTGWINHDSGGYLSFGVRVRSNGSYGVFGSADSGTHTYTAPRIPKAPSKPPTPVLQSRSVTEILYAISAPSDNGGSSITTYNHRAATDSSFGTIVLNWSSGATNQSASPLAPGTPHWIQYQALNSVGAGPWSDPLSTSTLPSSAPGLSAQASLTGESTTLTITPPPGGATVTKYRVERRLLGGTITASDTTSTTPTYSGLTPGATYQWRASAFYGDYETPKSDWVTTVQPNPNISVGQYFDGSSPALDDNFYRWNGAAGSSISEGVGYRPEGWSVYGGELGGLATIYRVTGGRSGGYAAQVLVYKSNGGAGLSAGISENSPGPFDVEPGGGYGGLIHVRIPGRTQRLAAEIWWLDAGYGIIGKETGAGFRVAPSATVWTPLRVHGVAPPGAQWGALRVVDVEGEGWSPWLPGDIFLLDDAIAPFDESYFDGNTPDLGRFIYEWEGEANQSPSLRLTSPDPEPDPLADPNCPPVPLPPRAPLIDEDCVGEPAIQWRRVWAEIHSGWVSTNAWSVPTLKIYSTQSIESMRIRYYQNPFNRPLVDLEQDDYCGEQLVSYLPPGVTFTIDGIMQRAWAEFDGSSEIRAADHLLRGDSSLMWPLLGCGVGYYITVDIPVDLPPEAIEVEFSTIQRY